MFSLSLAQRPLRRQLFTLTTTAPTRRSVPALSTPRTSPFTTTTAAMGVQKTILQEGTGPIPKPGQKVTMQYTGYLKDTSKPDNKGDKFDSSVGRGPFVCLIGTGAVIKGWDEGITTMKQGEKATLDITSDFAYGDRGFPGHIPPNASLIFDVELQDVK